MSPATSAEASPATSARAWLLSWLTFMLVPWPRQSSENTEDWDASRGYEHTIRTLHDAVNVEGNEIQFHVWAPNTDNEGTRPLVLSSADGGTVTAHHFESQGNVSWMNSGGNQFLEFSGTVPSVDDIIAGTDNSLLKIGYGAVLKNIGEAHRKHFSLWVSKGIVTEDIALANVSEWADYVFEDGYELKPLDEVEAFIEENHHLPGMPSEEEVKEAPLSLKGMNVKLLEKVEELTLYVISLQKEIDELKKSQ